MYEWVLQMRRFFVLVWVIFAWSHAQAQTIPIQYFTLPPQFIDIALSPDGRHMATLVLSEDRYILAIKDLDTPSDEPSVLFDADASISFEWIRWASPDRLLAGFPQLVKTSGFTGIGTRMIALGPEGQSAILLGSSDKKPPILFDEVIDHLPYEPNHILVNVVNDRSGYAEVRKVHLYTGETQQIIKAKKPIYRWMSDQNGQVRLGIGQTSTDRIIYIRDPLTERLETLWSSPLQKRKVFAPIAFTQDPNVIVVESNHAGGPTALYEYSLSQKRFLKRIFGNARVDVSGVLMNNTGHRLLGVNYVLDRTETHYLDPQTEKLARTIKSSIPDSQIQLLDVTFDGQRATLFAGSDTDPGRYYIFDNKARWLKEVGAVNSALRSDDLSPMIPVAYSARDGLQISGYLTLPKGVSQNTKPFLPTIILPHGGPTARDWQRYDYQVQFLVNRGYAVFQMNFRGSSGYGFDFEKAGYGQWGQAMQDDITDGVYWLINNGISDPNRICIYGASYGGYAALMGAVKTPDIFQCSVSLNGVSDLNQIVKYAKKSIGPFGAMHIGNERADRQSLREFSPLNRADDVGVPILLVHGNYDRTVPIDQSIQMANALKDSQKPVRFVVLEGSGHSLRQRRHRNRFLTELEMFLGEHIGPSTAQ